jgi:hypothetical protein
MMAFSVMMNYSNTRSDKSIEKELSARELMITMR